MKTASRLALVATLAAVVLAGCVRLQVNVSLHSDDTASGSFVVAIQEGAGEALGMSDEEAVKQFTSGANSNFANSTTEKYQQDGFVGSRIVFTDEPIESVSSEVASEGFSITRAADTFVVDGPFTPAEQNDETQIPPGGEFTFSITFPGKVTEHNGTLAGSTVTWDLTDPPASLHAVGGATGSGGLPPIVMIGVSIVVFLGAVVAIGAAALRSRRRALEETSNADSGGVAVPSGDVPSEPDVAPGAAVTPDADDADPDERTQP